MNSLQYIGSFKYEGKLAKNGIMDVRSASRALTGIDSSLRFFISQERPDLVGINLPIPVKIQEGSWEALIPTDLVDWIKTAGGIAITSYLYTAAQKLAEKDFKDVGLKDVVQNAISALQYLVRIGKHLGHLMLKNLENLTWEKKDSDDLVGIKNDRNEVLYVPIQILKRILSCPKNILADIASVIENERSLKISIFSKEKVIFEEITFSNRYLFYDDPMDLEVLFPELVHGMQVGLKGIVTRGNEMSNTIGFQYNGHILTCLPKKGSIVQHKNNLFLECEICGEITRSDKKGNPTENRPKIIFETLNTLKNQTELNLGLLYDEDEENV